MVELTDSQRAQAATLVRRARKAHGWTTQELADEAGVAGGTVNSVENAKKVRPGNLRAVLDALDLPAITQGDTDSDQMELALDLVRRWIAALPDDEVDPAVRDLTRFVMSRTL